MVTEEFTFPVITTNNNALNLALLPPLWRIASIDLSDDAELEQENNGRKRKMFTSFSGEIAKMMDGSKNDDKAEAEAQEKMDVLWEDFNEELQSTTADSSDSDFSVLAETYHPNHNKNNDEEFETLVECRNVRELKLVPAKRKKMELVVKMMKKLLQNTAAVKQRGPN